MSEANLTQEDLHMRPVRMDADCFSSVSQPLRNGTLDISLENEVFQAFSVSSVLCSDLNTRLHAV